jgi:hypothetical protein
MLTELISPTHKTPYVLDYILSKGLIRSGLTGTIRIELKHTCFYGSKDFYVYVENLSCSESHWTDSVNFRIDGIIPMHATEAGKLSYGFGCGCDTSHGDQFPSEAPPDNPGWDDYKKYDGEGSVVKCWIDSAHIEIDISQIPSGDPALGIITVLIETLLARQCFSEEVKKDGKMS